MKKVFLLLITFFICIFQVNAEDSYFMWHNSIDNAYTSSYDGMISNEVNKYQNNTIESLGDYKIRFDNFNAYDVILYEETTWELNGENTIDFIEESTNSTINLVGNGILKLQEIGLSLEEILSSKTPNLEEKIKSYLKGNYTLSIEEEFIVIKVNDEEETKPISFENKGFNITIKSASRVPLGTVFIAENKMDSLKEDISKKLDNEEVKYIYDFKLQDGEKTIEPKEEVEVSIKLDSSEYTVYYYDNKELEKIDSKYESDTLTFKTNHFSEYVITSPKEVDKEEEIEEEKSNEENYTLITCVSILIISIVVLFLVIITGKKK